MSTRVVFANPLFPVASLGKPFSFLIQEETKKINAKIKAAFFIIYFYKLLFTKTNKLPFYLSSLFFLLCFANSAFFIASPIWLEAVNEAIMLFNISLPA